MMPVDLIRAALLNAARELGAPDTIAPVLERPRDPGNGDWSTNLAPMYIAPGASFQANDGGPAFLAQFDSLSGQGDLYAGYAGNPGSLTTVIIGDGQTAVLGGILETERRDTEKKVPYLGDVPVLGHLFKSTSKVDNKDELLIFVTPKILREGVNVY